MYAVARRREKIGTIEQGLLMNRRSRTEQEPFGPALSIREQFNDQLAELEVDVFTIFCEDRWQPRLLIPQEIDQNLFYPELTYAGPDTSLYAVSFARLFEGLWFEDDGNAKVRSDAVRHGSVVGKLVEDARLGPGSRQTDRMAPVAAQLGPLGQTFTERENVESTAVFMSSRLPRRTQAQSTARKQSGVLYPMRDMLFFNFRRREKSCWVTNKLAKDEEWWRRLCGLASEIIDDVPRLIADQAKRSRPAAIRAIKAISSLVRSTEQRRQCPLAFRHDDPHIYDRLARDLQRALLHDEESEGVNGRQSDDLIVSIYLLEKGAARSSPGALRVQSPFVLGVHTPPPTASPEYSAQVHNSRSDPAGTPAPESNGLPSGGAQGGAPKGGAAVPEELPAEDNGQFFLRLKGSSATWPDEAKPLTGEDLKRWKGRSKSQWFLRPDRPTSITVLTTGLAAPHVLHRVDRLIPRSGDGRFNKTVETSLPLTTTQSMALKRALAIPMFSEREVDERLPIGWRSEPPSGLCHLGTRLPNLEPESLKTYTLGFSLCIVRADAPPPPGGAEYRLLVQHPDGLVGNPDLGSDVELELVSTKLRDWIRSAPSPEDAAMLEPLVEKLRRRMYLQHAHVFGHLDMIWEGPSSEVCVPLFVAGRAIGCINIESRTINRFNPSYLGILSTCAMIIEMEHPAALHAAMETSGHRVIQQMHRAMLHRPDDQPHLETVGGLFGLNEFARTVAQACWADRAFVAATPAHRDGQTRFLAVSEPAWHAQAKWELPRPQGSTTQLSRARWVDGDGLPCEHGVSGAREVIGLLLADCSSPSLSNGRSGIAEWHAYWIVSPLTKGDATSSAVASIGKDDSDAPAPGFVPVPPPVTTALTVRGDPEGCPRDRMLIAFRLETDLHGTPTDDGLNATTLWLAFRRHAFRVDESGELPRDGRPKAVRDHVIRHLDETARRAEGVIATWNSTVFNRLERETNVAHAGGMHSAAIESLQFVAQHEESQRGWWSMPDVAKLAAGAGGPRASLKQEQAGVAPQSPSGPLPPSDSFDSRGWVAVRTDSLRPLCARVWEEKLCDGLSGRTASLTSAADLDAYLAEYKPLARLMAPPIALADPTRGIPLNDLARLVGGVTLGDAEALTDPRGHAKELAQLSIEYTKESVAAWPADRPLMIRPSAAYLVLFLLNQIVRNGRAAFYGTTELLPDYSLLTFRLTAERMSDASVRVEVSNNGPGLPEDMDEDKPAFRRKGPSLFGAKRGRGLDLCLRAARLLVGPQSDSPSPGTPALTLSNFGGRPTYRFTLGADCLVFPVETPETKGQAMEASR